MVQILGIALWALIPGFVAKKKGRNFWGYYFLSFVITPLVTMIIAFCLSDVSETENKEAEMTTKDVDEISFCRKCGEQLIDNSKFCRKCGTEMVDEFVPVIVEENVEEFVVDEIADIEVTDSEKATQEETLKFVINGQEETVRNLEGKKSEKRVKNRFCKMCGSQVDIQTKKCSGCGKQYFKGIKFNKFITTVLILSIVISTSVILNIFQFLEINELNEDKEYYKEKSTGLSKAIKVKNQHLNFYEKYAAIVPDDGSKKYHIYGCDALGNSSFWIYNINAAEEEGYSACSECY